MRPVPLTFAAGLGVFLWLRRRRLEPTVLAGGGLLIAVLLVYGSGLVKLPNVHTFVEDLGGALGAWTYLLVGALAFLETGAFVGLLAPGETFMVFGGVVAGQGRIDLFALIAIVWAAAVAGDVTSFVLGRRLGRAFMVKHGPKVQITESRLQQVEAFFGRHGGKAILLGRFVGLVRAIAPFLAGSSGMRLRRFLPYDVIGAGLWASAFVVLGYVFWQSFDRVLNYAEKGALALGTTITVIVGAVVAIRWLRAEENRRKLRAFTEAQLERPALRPLARVVRPAWRFSRRPRRFVWARITPGGLGLEMTTLLAVFSVGAFAFGSLTATVDQQRFTTGDLKALQTTDDLHADWLVDIAKVVTDLGSLGVTGPAVLLTALLLLWRRRITEAVMLVGAMGLTYAAVHITKDAIDRPRPPRPLDGADGSSFPSGHAAYAVAWVVIAIVIGRALPGAVRGATLVVVAAVLAVAVGLTRIYLRVHYLSDVLAGAGLAAAIYALFAMVALVVAHTRQNVRGS